MAAWLLAGVQLVPLHRSTASSDREESERPRESSTSRRGGRDGGGQHLATNVASGGLLAFLALIGGLFVVRGGFARDPRWGALAGPTRWVAWLTLAGMVARIIAEQTDVVPGLVERVFDLVPLVWLIAAALRLRHLGPTPHQLELADSSPPPGCRYRGSGSTPADAATSTSCSGRRGEGGAGTVG